jgi:hypothetical protein
MYGKEKCKKKKFLLPRSVPHPLPPTPLHPKYGQTGGWGRGEGWDYKPVSGHSRSFSYEIKSSKTKNYQKRWE